MQVGCKFSLAHAASAQDSKFAVHTRLGEQDVSNPSCGLEDQYGFV